MSWPEFLDRHFVALWALSAGTVFLACALIAGWIKERKR